MNKSIYEKWDELRDCAKNSNNIVLAEYYLFQLAQTKMYFGEDKSNQYIYIEFSKNYLVDVDMPIFKGLDISISREPSIDPNQIYIKVKNNTDNDALFIALSSSLYERLLDTKDYNSAFVAFIETLKEYKDFFKNPDYTLSLQEEQGLCAELQELLLLIQKKGVDSVYRWQGPNKNKRDFVFEGTSLEIKSTLSQIDSSIYISNENQLDPSYPDSLSKLFLKVYVFERDDNGFDVISCANEVLTLLGNNKAESYFISNLMKLKIDINVYRPKYRFTLQACKQYRVTEFFPSILKEQLSDGVFNVEYRVKLNALNKYEISEKELHDGLQ